MNQILNAKPSTLGYGVSDASADGKGPTKKKNSTLDLKS